MQSYSSSSSSSSSRILAALYHFCQSIWIAEPAKPLRVEHAAVQYVFFEDDDEYE
jgi:hypothetical protein